MSPDAINAKHGEPVYRCRVCRVATGLQWFNGTSCPVCSKQECCDALWREWDAALEAQPDDETLTR